MNYDPSRKSYANAAATPTAAVYANLTRHDAIYDAITMLASALAGGLIVWAVMV